MNFKYSLTGLFLLCFVQMSSGQKLGLGINLTQSSYKSPISSQSNTFMPSVGFDINFRQKIKGNHFIVTGAELLNFNTTMRSSKEFANGTEVQLRTRPRVSVIQVPIAYELVFRPEKKAESFQKFVRVGLALQTLRTSGFSSRSFSERNLDNPPAPGSPFSLTTQSRTTTTENRIFDANPFVGLGGYLKNKKGKYVSLAVTLTSIRNVPNFSVFHLINEEINTINSPKSVLLFSIRGNYYMK